MIPNNSYILKLPTYVWVRGLKLSKILSTQCTLRKYFLIILSMKRHFLFFCAYISMNSNFKYKMEMTKNFFSLYSTIVSFLLQNQFRNFVIQFFSVTLYHRHMSTWQALIGNQYSVKLVYA